MSRFLVVRQCPNHGTFMVALEDTSNSGVLLSKSKCCGSWSNPKGCWELKPAELRAMANELECAAEALERMHD